VFWLIQICWESEPMNAIKKVFQVLIPLSLPMIISFLVILGLLSPLFMNLEYQRTGFPEDSFGFTTEERLKFGNITRRYLVSGMTLDDLRELKFPDGQNMYQERELVHLEDVKVILKGLSWVFYATVGVVILGGFFARNYDWLRDYFDSIALGGKITTGLLILLLIFTLVSFQNLFTNFHLIFFEGDSWLFAYSDTLIRLYPIIFWRDVFLVFGISSLLLGILIGWILPRFLKSTTK
jgi:integral membrane protein (TIGR01906 family)